MNKKTLKWRFLAIAAVLAACFYYAMPPFDPDGEGPRQGKIKLGLDLQGGMHLVLRVDTAKLPENAREDATERALEIIRNRIDQFGVAEPSIQRQGSDRIVVQLPGVSDRERALSLIGKTALLEFKLVSDDEGKLAQALAGSVPDGFQLYHSSDDNNQLLLEKDALLTGKTIVDAGVSFESQFNEPVVTLEFNSEGGKLFSDITGAHVGRRLAIVLDDKVQSAPVINERIPSGQAQITGRFNLQEASDLSIALRAGALPAPIVIEEERSVGPSLGKDSVEQGIQATLIASLLVLLFVATYYLASGIVADIAMVVNLILVAAFLAYFRATLTVPGIAGLILTIGMNVDTNVLILERIREELRLGKNVVTAVNAGYQRAFGAIFDGNLTALLTGLILYNLGTGPIRGFAITMIIGIIGSFFTGIFVTRAFTDLLLSTGALKKLPMLSLMKKTPNIDFLKPRKLFYGAGVLTVCACVYVIATGIQGRLGIDFTGGELQEYRFQNPVRAEDVREALKEVGLETATIQEFGNDREIIIRAPKTDESVIQDAMEKKFTDNPHEVMRVESVGPIVGEELRGKSLWAIALSLVSVMAYLAFRFQFRYSVAALAAVFHDALVCLTAVILTGREMSIPVLAAVLTTIGYQVNDTIVTFDRVRENVRKQPGKVPYGQIVNLSINETLSRTFLTSFSVFLAVGSLYLFGGPVINDFAFTMLVGLISGTYSTIFLACPMVVDWPGRAKR